MFHPNHASETLLWMAVKTTQKARKLVATVRHDLKYLCRML
jgi:hypothetical protein